MKTIKKYLLPTLMLGFMFCFTAAVILYQRGAYDFAFAPRVYASDDSDEAVTYKSDLEDDGEEYDEPEAQKDNLSAVFDDSHIIEETKGQSVTPATSDDGLYEAALSKKSVTELKALGYKHSTADFVKSTHVIGQVTTSIDFNSSLYGKNTEYTLSPYMGYVIYDDGKNVSLLGINGVVSVAGINKLGLTYLRDSYGRPLFSLGDKYYYVVDNSNEMIEVSADPNYAPSLLYDRRAADYFETGSLRRYYAETVEPHKFNADGEDITDEVDHILSEAAKDGKDVTDPEVYAKLKIPDYTYELVPVIRWGYVNEYGSIVIPAQYNFASEFDANGYAVVAERWGVAKVINSRGSTVISLNSRVSYPEERSRRPVQENYYLPDSFGLESIGMFAFDHGMIRLRYIQYDYKKETEIVRDRDVLVYEDGSLFPIPSDYSLRGYSCGVLLLEKNGKYGFMDYTGKWIAQPIYTYAQPFIEGLAVIGFEDGKKGMIDTDGNIIMPFRYDYLSNLSSGVFTAFTKAEGWTIFNKLSK